MFEYTRCEVCNEDNTRLLFTRDNFNIVRCKNCSLVYVNPRLSKEDIHKIYDENYFASRDSVTCGYDDYLAEKDSIIKTFKKRFASIERLKKPGKLLDLGCAAGFLLKIAEEKGWEAYGLEVSEYIASCGKKELNVNILCTDLLEKKFEDSFFDVVILWDVVEHLTHLKSYLDEICRILKKDGMISISTPDVSSISARLMGKRWIEFDKPREHLYFFSSKLLKRFLMERGFSIVGRKMVGKFVTLEFAVRRLQEYNRPFFKFVESVIRLLKMEKVYVNVNPFDKMMINARKV